MGSCRRAGRRVTWCLLPASSAQRAPGARLRCTGLLVVELGPRTPVSRPQACAFESYVLAKMRINHKLFEEDPGILNK